MLRSRGGSYSKSSEFLPVNQIPEWFGLGGILKLLQSHPRDEAATASPIVTSERLIC